MNKKYQEPEGLNDVAQFHETFELPIEECPIIPAPARCDLRVNLLQEELNELKEAIENDDLVEVADALCDIQYVLSGAILEFGLADRFKELFDEVQRSNMSKTCKSYEEAIQTQAHYLKEKDTKSEIVERGEEYLVYREGDRKVLKSIAYSPADIKGLLDGVL
ncbi:MAG: putative HAD superfamily Cof-like phosphohydrolase [Saprospiraceae bacterium]|jgi:predicted HAD superfamily Cof-like phosphohydrolase